MLASALLLALASVAGTAQAATDPYVATTPAAGDIGTANAVASGWGAVAIGSNAVADTNQYGTAVGAGSHAAGYSSMALGVGASTDAHAFGAVAIGLNAVANEDYVVSFGHAAGDVFYLAGSQQSGTYPAEVTRRLIHVSAGVDATDAVNKGQLDAAIAGVSGVSSYLVAGLSATPADNVAAVASAANSTAVGAHAVASQSAATALGQAAQAVGVDASALGSAALASGSQSLAVGHASQAVGSGSVALGDSAVASAANVASFGHAATDLDLLGNAYGSDLDRRLTHVADGVDATDAATVGQLDGLAGNLANAVSYSTANKASVQLGGTGGSVIDNLKAGDASSASSMQAVNGGQLYATNQTVQAHADTLADHASKLLQDRQDIDAASSAITTFNQTAVFYTSAARSQVLFGVAGTPVRLGNVAAGVNATDAVNKAQLDAVVAQAGQASANAVTYDDASKSGISLAGSDGTTVHNVAAGSAATDAVNKSQLDAVGQQVDQLGNWVDTNTAAIGQNTAAIGQLDGRVGTLEGQVGALQQGAAVLGRVAVDGSAGEQASVAAGSHGVAIGANAAAGGDHGTALGGDSHAAGPNDTAVGGNARVDADGSTAVGANTAIAASATNAVAVGESASVDAASATAVGQGASATAQGAVALGQGAVADQADTVSVGNATQQRRIVNVAAGTAGSDAANVTQLDAGVEQAVQAAKAYADHSASTTLHSANVYTDQRIAQANWQFNQFRGEVDHRFNALDARIDRVNAMGAASTQMAINAAGADSGGRVAAGVGFSGGRSAISVGFGAPIGTRMHISFGATHSGTESSAGFGFGVDL